MIMDSVKEENQKRACKAEKICYNTGRKVNKAGRFARHGTDAGSGMGCKSPRVGHCDARTPRSVRYVRTRPVLLPSPGVYGRIFCPHGWWLCGLFVWRFSSPGKRRPESCTTHVLSGQSSQIPLCGVLSTKRAPFGVGNRRRGIFCDEIAIGRLCPAAGAGRF